MEMFERILRKLQDQTFLEQAISLTEEPEEPEPVTATYSLSSTSP
jgi:hypothetical protein